jgi:uncharacterized OB-fold protein
VLYKGMDLRVLPTDSEHRGRYEAAGRGELVLQACQRCDRLRAIIGAACPWCRSRSWSWRAVSGLGTIWSYGIAVRAVNPAFSDWVPYPVVVVELDEQRGVPWPHGGIGDERVFLRLVTNLVTRHDPTTPEREEVVAIGRRVEACFAPLGEGLALPQFRLTADDLSPTPCRGRRGQRPSGVGAAAGRAIEDAPSP